MDEDEDWVCVCVGGGQQWVYVAYKLSQPKGVITGEATWDQQVLYFEGEGATGH